MKRFTQEKSHTLIKPLLSVGLFLVIFLIFLLMLSKVSSKTSTQRAELLQQSISRSIAHCYATEGRYPESLDYLIENYGIYYDTSEFFVDYQTLGENIFPDVKIINKQEESQ